MNIDVVSIVVSTEGARSGSKLYADYYGIKLDTVSHGENYSFRYENIIAAGFTDKAKFTDAAEATVRRTCSVCGKKFDAVSKETTCPSCSMV